MSCTFGAKVALESSWGDAFFLADPSSMEGSSQIKSLAPDNKRLLFINQTKLHKIFYVGFYSEYVEQKGDFEDIGEQILQPPEHKLVYMHGDKFVYKYTNSNELLCYRNKLERWYQKQ